MDIVFDHSDLLMIVAYLYNRSLSLEYAKFLMHSKCEFYAKIFLF